MNTYNGIIVSQAINTHVLTVRYKITVLIREFKGSRVIDAQLLFEPRHEKTGLWGFRPGATQTGLYSHRRWLEA